MSDLRGVIAGLFLFLFLLLPAGGASAFAIPEKLVFDLTWSGLKAGTATMEITGDPGSVKIVSTAHSASWVSVFYTVDNRIETLLAKADTPLFIGLPYNYRLRIREGRHRRDKEVIFDHAKLTAFFIDHLRDEKKNVGIQENTLDPLSSFYFIRTLHLEAGKSVYVEIFDSKKLWNVEVQVIRKEKIRTKLGEFDTVVIKPLMKSEGIFSRKGDMYIWLTDDARRLPVKMQTKAPVGNITATLTGGTY